MKKINGLIAGAFTLLLLLTSCNKAESNMDTAQINIEKANVNSALVLSKAYNDTLIMIYDTVSIKKNNPYCIKYDKLYHQKDSMFTKHYSMFGDEMYKNGFMINNYTPGMGMMQGGMMSSGSSDYKQMMGDTAMVGGYYRDMHKLRTEHQVYHNGIYN